MTPRILQTLHSEAGLQGLAFLSLWGGCGQACAAYRYHERLRKTKEPLVREDQRQRGTEESQQSFVLRLEVRRVVPGTSPG